ncbi:MAG TPA: chemotaxis protein CheD [Phycisphaerae bacterium]|nr:chemotaxis protein CheD [Phycisphaerae bacterium]
MGISDARASADERDELVTYSLGSCIAVTLYDAEARVGGLLHYQLPSSQEDPQRAKERPLMFGDTGTATLIEKMKKLGALKGRMQVKMAGAAQMLNDTSVFDIGRRNHAAIRKVFWELGMFIDAEHVGGSKPRTMRLNVADGAVTVKCDAETFIL